MKQTFLIGLMAMLSFQSHALVADKFKCTTKVQEVGSTNVTEQKQEFFVARIPLSKSEDPDIRYTAAEASSSLVIPVSTGRLSIDMNFFYKHAIKNDAYAKPIDARQFSCVTVSAMYCSDPSGLCAGSTQQCFEPADPFNATIGWSKSTLIDDVPTFNGSAMNTITVGVGDEIGNVLAELKIDCQFLGTYN